MEKREIEEKFDAIANHYDSQRRALIPCFDSFYRTIVEAIPYRKSPRILDIGAGTGLLTHFILDRFPDALCTLIDISGDMLAQAKERFQNSSHISYIEADYSSFCFTESYDIVVSTLSIHHLRDDEKEKLYQTVYTVLHKGGIFINGDQFLGRSSSSEERNLAWWRQKITETSLSKEEIANWEERVAMDIPATVEQNLTWLDSAGFTNVDLLYKMYNFGIITGTKE